MERYVAIFIMRKQVAVRCGRVFFGWRSSHFKEYWSERKRKGWRVRYLPGGSRLFLKGDA